MAAKKSSKYPYQWPDGTWHSRPATTPDVGGYSPEQINVLNGILPGGTGVQGVAGVTDTPGGNIAGFQPPPPVTPQPVDPAYENAKLGAGFNIQTADGEAKYQRGETAWSSGINADGSLNTSNPYSDAMRLQDNYKRSVMGVNNSASSALYSGARVNQHAIADRHYAENSSALKDQARQGYHGIDYGQLSAYGSNAAGTSGAGYDALKRSVYGG